jgi:hypothetical protein
VNRTLTTRTGTPRVPASSGSTEHSSRGRWIRPRVSEAAIARAVTTVAVEGATTKIEPKRIRIGAPTLPVKWVSK